MLLRSWVRRNPAVGLFIAGILRRLLERAVLSAIELKHFFGKYRFVYIFIDKIVTVLYIVKFYAEQHTGARCESLNECRLRRSYCVMKSLMLCIK